MKTYVVGHKNPDTDSILSAIIAADLLGDGSIAAKQGEPNKETIYALRQFGFDVPIDLPSGERRIAIVDHNSHEEGPDDLKPEEIVALYDHHKLGGPVTADLIEVRIEKVGCTATVLAGLYKERGQTLGHNIAGLIVSAIVSDTLNLTSPTTTEKDKEAVAELSKQFKIDIDGLAEKMFAAKSDISDVPTEELIEKDYKVFEMGTKKVGIGVWETVLPDTVLDRKEEIIESLKVLKSDQKLDAAFFAVVDILKNGSEMIICDQVEEDALKAAFSCRIVDNVAELPGVVSRKKQMTPQLHDYFAGQK